MQRHLVWAAILVCAIGKAAASGTTVPRYLEFRDGSVLRLPVVDEDWKLTVLRPDGGIDTTTVPLSSLQEIRLTPDRVFDKKRAMLAAVEKMGADEFSNREQGQEELIRMGPAVRPDLEVALQLFSDVEIQYRLKQVLGKWPEKPEQTVPGNPPFDFMTAEKPFWGDAGEARIPVQVDGAIRRLSRQDVRLMSVRPPAVYSLGIQQPGPAEFRRIQAKDFPPGCIEEGFETAPDGRRLTAGENVEKLFVSKGFALSTSVKTSYVAVNEFRVDGKTPGLSVATHEPLYQGEVTIRFVQPGREDVPAGVTYFGCWMAVVMANGTSLVAYDMQGREIGNIHTEHGPHEFMAVQSAVLMHEIRVVPNLQVDPDYTLDDFIFTPPQSADVRHPEKFTVQLGDSERILCREVSFTPEGIRAQGLPAGLPDRTIGGADLVRVSTPTRGRPDYVMPPGVFLELRDGSVIFGASSAGSQGGVPVFARRPQILKERKNVVELWRADFPRPGWPAQTSSSLVWDADKKSWQKVADVKLTEEGVVFTPENGQPQTRPYPEVPALLLGQPAEPTAGAWHVRTVQGEEIVLDEGEPFPFAGNPSIEVTAVWQGKPLKIAAADLASVVRVPVFHEPRN